MPSNPDRPKNPSMRKWLVTFSDGEKIEIEAEYRGMARHYAKSFVERNPMSSIRHYTTVKSARLMKAGYA
jgi:hypothetical protein